MGIIQQLRDARRQTRLEASQKVAQEIRQQLLLSPVCSDYENLFAQVRPLINDMKVVRPFGVNEQGKPLRPSKTPELAILNSPNDEMSWAEFSDLCFATWLTKDQLYIHVHFDDKRRNIIGYTVIPATAAFWNGHEVVWNIELPDGTMREIHRDEVMTLRFSRSPDDPYRGVSPASAIRVWAQTDDLVAQYQRAYFENGAIPATITFITASTQDKYNAIRRELEMKTKGAKNQNKTVYAWRQMLPETGQTADQIEVKTIQGGNNTLAIDSIVKIINDRLNKAVGVSNFILGDDASAKYSNAELSDQQFIKRRVFPALMSFWSQFQHELDRITGGLGYGIQFRLEVPELTERAAQKADTAKVNADTITQLIQAGADPTSTVKALQLPEAWTSVAAGIYNKVLAEQSSPNILSQETNTKSRAATVDHRCCCADQHTILDAEKLTPAERKLQQILLDYAERIIFENPNLDTDQVIAEINKLLEQEAIKGVKLGQEQALKIVESDETRAAIEASIKEAGKIKLASPLEDKIRSRTNIIVRNYEAEVRDAMAEVLNDPEPQTAAQIRNRLKEIIPAYRAQMIARNETLWALRSGHLQFNEQICQDFGCTMELTWRCQHDKETCDTCAAYDGQKTFIGSPYAAGLILKQGDKLANGKIVGFPPKNATEAQAKLYTNTLNFGMDRTVWNDQGQIPQAHVNCRCYFDERLIWPEDE